MIDRRLATGLAAALVLALTAASAFAQDAKPPEAKDPAAGGKDAPKPGAAPEAKQDPAKPETPPAAAPEAAPEKKRKKGPLGLPDLRTLKEALTLSKDQFKQVKELYESYGDKVKEAETKAKENPDKKAARKELKPLHDEIAAKLRELCSEEQKPKLDELLAPPKKQKEGQKEAPKEAQK